MDNEFTGSIPQIYERYLVPLIFETYAVDLATRVAHRNPSRVLELAAGTGVVTRQLATLLPATAPIVATDLNQPMLDQAASIGTQRPVEWRAADAMRLPFADETFDLVVCQFGVMFFPDKAQAFAEARRVLRSGGAFLFNVWDRIEQNEFADTVTRALQERLPEDPPMFMARVPHGYYDVDAIERELVAAGFREPRVETLAARSRAESARIPAIAYCQGTPLRLELEARGLPPISATDIAESALAKRFGLARVDGKIQALVIGADTC